MSVLTNRCKCPEYERQIVYKILGALNLTCFRTCSIRQPSVFRDIDAGGDFASKLLEPLYNHHLAHNQLLFIPPLNSPPHLTIPLPLYLSTLYTTHYTTIYLCYSLLFITDCVPSPVFILNTYNFNCQRLM